MTRTSRSRLSYRMPAARRPATSYRLRVPELLEDRTVPAVTIEPAGANQFIVRFTEDLPGAADTVLLRVNNGGLLEHSTNGAAFTTDLNSAVAGTQSLAASAVSRIDVLLGAGDDVLGVDGLFNPAVIPIPPGGIVFAAGPGTDRLDLSHGQNMVLTATALTVAGRTVTFTDLDAARLTGGTGDSVLDAAGFGGPVTLDGGNGKDTLIGGSGNDVLLGVAGADSMDGRGGNDQLFSGNSGTTMIGGAGNDTLNGGNGPDQASGGDGDDALFGGNGGDALDGGLGNDTFYGGLGNDTALGGDGADRIVGAGDMNWTLTNTSLTGEGTDILIGIEEGLLVGGVGPNALNASAFSGFVTLQGGGGNDILTGGTGHNVFNRPPGELGSVTMIGGPAGSFNDYFLLPQGTTLLTSPGGHDRLNFGTAVSLDLTNANGGLQVVDAAGSVISLTGLFEDFLGSGGDDTVVAESNTVITPGSGKDTVVVIGKSNVFINGGADADTLQQTDGINITLSGDDGLDTLTSTRGTGVTLSGGRDADSLQTIDGTNIILNGGADADSLQTVDGTNIILSGDDGLDTLTSTRGTGVTLSGGRDADSLQTIDGSNITLSGDDGLDTLTSTRGTGVTLSGGRDADSLQSIDGTNIILNGDDGLDTLTSTRGTGVTLSGGRDADTLQSVDGTNIILNGGADADTLQSFDGTTIILNGDDGLDTLTSTRGTGVTLSGGRDADSLQSIDGSNIILNGDDGLDTLTSTRGTGVTLSGGRDADSLQSIDGSNIILNGDDGLDTLTSTRGTGVTLSGGRDADTLQSFDGTNIVLSGDDGLDTLTSTRGTGVTLSGGRDADSLQTIEGTTIVLNGDDGLDTLISTRATGVTLSGGRDADTLISEGGTQIVMSGDEGHDRLVVSGATLDTINGGPGNDTIVLAGASLGTVVIAEAAVPAPDTSLDTLDFSGFTGGPINLNLGLTGLQTVTPGALVMNVQDPGAIENVIGTAGADTVTGNGRDNLLLGADPLNPPAGPAPAWDGVTQVVFLNFGTVFIDPGEHAYDAAEKAAIQARLVADYVGPNPASPWFHVEFVLDRPASYPYAEVQFNEAPPDGGTGGFAHELDFRNTNLGTADNPSIATVQVNGILGAPNQPPESFDNWVALSSKIAAHELGHLVGLLHQDSFGPIGFGPHAPPGGAAYNPAYPGPSAGFETFNHLMSSPASVGSNRTNDLRDLYFGEREAVKLTVSESGTVLAESGVPHGTFATAQPLTLAALAVPNTVGAGLNAPKAFSVDALVVTGGIEAPAGVSESDFYSFAGKKGDLVNIEVLSTALSRLGDNTIDAMIRVYDASNTLVAYFETPAVNDDQFEAIDAVIMDLVLPADGTYYLEVDTFNRAGEPDNDTGAYELLVYRFDAGNANDAGDVLNGQGGNDTAAGGLGDDVYVIPAAGSDAVVDPSGRDTLDFSAAPAGVTVNLALDAGQNQTVTALGGTLAVTGTIELAFGSPFADSITGNAADNRLFGGAGNDTMAGGLGNDVVIGGAGNDTLNGDDGRDLLVGGLGVDVLRGFGGDDVLIGGQTTYDANVSALDALMAEWTRTDQTYNQRVAHLTGTTTGGLNGTTYLIKGTTVLDDAGAEDTLTGGLGLDLFFGFTKDKVMDREAPTETVL